MSIWKPNSSLEISDVRPSSERLTTPIYRTQMGSMYCAKTEELLAAPAFKSVYDNDVQLVFTSPPFPLNAKKKYGNLQGEEYIEWLAGFAPTLKNLVTDDGSIAIEIGNAWEPGLPVMSTVVMEALLRFLKEADLHLCQEFVWYNPARLPSPIQWVNVERIRVKDAFTRIWWMSPTDRPKADNRNVLRPYSKSMQRLIKTGKYNSGRRPSEHIVGEKSFAKDNGGAIPPNVGNVDEIPSLSSVLKGSNTRSYDDYQSYCRDNGIDLHPARMPADLVKFFVRFLTDPDDIVFDPFGGSNTTGSIAESEGRKWASCDADWKYASSSITRFQPGDVVTSSKGIAIQKKRGRPVSDEATNT